MSVIWRYAYASAPGRHHIINSVLCQDFCDCRVINTSSGESIFVGVASDGAGSAKYGEKGSKLACFLITDEIKGFLESGNKIKDLNRGTVEHFINILQCEVASHASVYGSTTRDFACTLICAVSGAEESVFFQIGDGAIVTSVQGEKDEYRWVFWPKKGQYVNTTYFVTDQNACSTMEYRLIEGTMDKIAVFTDGVQGLALHYESKTAHSPFFQTTV